ncbi:MAG: transporter [Bacteroidetes bacterium CG12_big_fil_rev_8_21_14_0_65_60_17]|nr:MAG: transporter [Bacteroidetes bacterium CG12_big_fil_rev_8_21_14_0_65_60_17]
MTLRTLLPYLFLGIAFGILATKGEVISWFRIQEMFRFQSFHMYGIIAGAITVSAASIRIIRRRGLTTASGEPVALPAQPLSRFGTQYWLGGTIFGLGWALTGACPAPMFALLGNGIGVMSVLIVSALAGTYAYGRLRPWLPH